MVVIDDNSFEFALNVKCNTFSRTRTTESAIAPAPASPFDVAEPVMWHLAIDLTSEVKKAVEAVVAAVSAAGDEGISKSELMVSVPLLYLQTLLISPGCNWPTSETVDPSSGFSGSRTTRPYVVGRLRHRTNDQQGALEQVDCFNTFSQYGPGWQSRTIPCKVHPP
jgi:hypothetical protein